MSRPPGRSPQECRVAFDQLRANHPPPPVGRPQAAPYPPPSSQFIQRAFIPPEGPPPASSSRNIQPRPEGVPHSIYPATGSLYTLQPSDQPFKKRGRPSNAELELRKQEYEARGETYPPPRSRKRSKMPGGVTTTSPTTSRVGGGTTPAESGSGTSSQRASYAGYSEQSPTSAGPARRSPGTMDPPISEQRPSVPPQYGHERGYGQSRYGPPQGSQQTSPQQAPQQASPQAPPAPPSQQPRLPSPSGYSQSAIQGPMLPRLMPSPHASIAQGPPRPLSQAFPQAAEPPHRRGSPPRTTGEPMEH